MGFFDRMLMRSGAARAKPPPSARRRARYVAPKFQTFARRFWAALIDGILLTPLVFFEQWLARNPDMLPAALLFGGFLLTDVAYYLYTILLHGRFGQTVGKMVTGVKVLAVEETALGYRRAFLRDAVPLIITLGLAFLVWPTVQAGGNPYEVSATTYGWPWVFTHYTFWAWFWAEILTMLASRKRRALHDFIAGSVVVRLDVLRAEQTKAPPSYRVSGSPVTAMRPITLFLIIGLLVSGFGWIQWRGSKNATALLMFDAHYSDARLVRNLDGADPAVTRATLAALARRRSEIAVEQALLLVEQPEHRADAALYLAAAGRSEAVPHLIQHLSETDRLHARHRVISSLQKLTGHSLGTDADAWISWWNTQNPEQAVNGNSDPAETE